ncbi:hypothetical protein [Pseudomonas sp. NPDC087336]|jgi:hypothetical protein
MSEYAVAEAFMKTEHCEMLLFDTDPVALIDARPAPLSVTAQ